MFVVIVGAESTGCYLARLLQEEGHVAALIEKEEDVCQKARDALKVLVTHGNATDPKVLEKANIKNADAVVSLTGNDQTNMVVCLLAKELGAKKTACRIGQVEYDENALKKLGIDVVVHPEAASAGYIAELLTKPEILDHAFISRGEIKVLELELKEGSQVAGKKVKDIEQPAGTLIVALYEKDKLVIAGPQTTLVPGTKLFVIAKKEVLEKTKKLLE